MNVLVGSLSDPKEYQGLAHFLEHMAFKGTKTKTALQIMEKVESVGGYINAYTSEEITAYWVKLLAEDLNTGIEIISDILQNSIFEEKELERKRKLAEEYLRKRGKKVKKERDTPDFKPI